MWRFAAAATAVGPAAPCAAVSAASCGRIGLAATARSFTTARLAASWRGASEPHLQRQAAPAPSAGLPFRERERERAPSEVADTALAPAQSASELKAAQDQAMDRATRKARRVANQRRRTQTRRPMPAAEWVPPPPLYHPAPFAALPVIPDPKETLQSALIRVDKVPKSPGFGKEVGRVRGQMAKYNFVARRQLEVAALELATKLEQRLDLFPRIPAHDANDAPTLPTDPDAPQTAQLHPFDASLLTCSMAGGSREYTSLLNHGRNLVNKLRGAHRAGLQALNHSKSIWESREVHRKAILRMKDLWKEGEAASEATGGSGQPSGFELVERLRRTSQMLRHLPTIDFRRNLLDARADVASYLSVLPQDIFRLPAEQLTFERLRPYLPPSPPYTLALLGAPNVGKSSLLLCLSHAKVEVAPFAFTTTTLQMGHLEREEEASPGWLHHSKQAQRKAKRAAGPHPLPRYTPAVPLTRVQLIDTPGLLFRPDSMRKAAEKIALTAAQHINPLLCAFVLDPTGTSGMTVRLQRFLRRELQQRCRTHTPPHERASETDPANRLARDPLYANVAADARLQSLQQRLQSISWLDIASKTDVRKSAYVKDEVLRRGESQGSKDVRTVEQEIADAAQQDQQPETEAESTETALALAGESVPPKPRIDRATWKLNEIRTHIHRYLCDANGRIVLEDEPDRPLTLCLPADSAADSSAAPHSSSSSSSSSVLSVSTETGSGLEALELRIWHEVDHRESLRLEAAFVEMKSRILWMRGESTLAAFATDAPQVATNQRVLIEQ